MAVFRNGLLINTHTFPPPYSQLRDMLNLADEVVCEKGPSIRRQAEACEPVEALVKEFATNVHWVRPTAWKPSPFAVIPQGYILPLHTIHERDAARMGEWFLTQKARSGQTPAS